MGLDELHNPWARNNDAVLASVLIPRPQPNHNSKPKNGEANL